MQTNSDFKQPTAKSVAPRPIRVLIVDDHPVVREGLAAIIDRCADMCVVGQAVNGREGVALFQQQRPDVVLIDLRMPVMDGVTAITQIRRDNSEACIMILTISDGEEDIYRGLHAGARAYLLKDTPREELLESIRMAHHGQTRLAPQVAVKLAQRISQAPLTPREMDVLRLMAQGNSNLEIANNLYIAEGTVKAHVNSILDKMDVSDRTQAVMLALRRGMVHLE